MLGISFLNSFILAFRVVLVAKLKISGILSSIFLIVALLYLNQQEQVLIYQHLIYQLYFSNCLTKLVHFSIYQYLIINPHQILN